MIEDIKTGEPDLDLPPFDINTDIYELLDNLDSISIVFCGKLSSNNNNNNNLNISMEWNKKYNMIGLFKNIF